MPERSSKGRRARARCDAVANRILRKHGLGSRADRGLQGQILSRILHCRCVTRPQRRFGTHEVCDSGLGSTESTHQMVSVECISFKVDQSRGLFAFSQREFDPASDKNSELPALEQVSDR